MPDPTAPSAIIRPTGEPFVRVVSPVGGLSDKIPAASGARGLKPAMVEIGKDLHVTPLEAQAARLEIRTGLRKAQRKGIREKNFLSTLKA